MTALNVTSFSFMTAVVNSVRSPNTFVRRFLFPAARDITLPTEKAELSFISRGREIAPFVRRGGEAIMVGGHSASNAEVETTNIRIKRPFTPRALMFVRRPWQNPYLSDGQDLAAYAKEQMGRELQDLADMVANAEEYLSCMSLQGAITYTNSSQETFTITYPRPGANSITLTTFWNDGTPANVRVLSNFHTAKQVAAEAGFALTDVILGVEAAASLRSLAEGGHIKVLGMDGRNIDAGRISFLEQFRDDGVIYMGNLAGIDIWEYPRTAVLDGVSVSMIRPKYAEFISRSAATERTMYFGAIDDMDAIKAGTTRIKRFSKSWEEKDPSATIALIHSKPLPVPRKVDAWVSMKVISG
jgi:hypothetical protein